MDHLKRPNDYSRYQTLHYIRYHERNFEAYAVARLAITRGPKYLLEASFERVDGRVRVLWRMVPAQVPHYDPLLLTNGTQQNIVPSPNLDFHTLLLFIVEDISCLRHDLFFLLQPSADLSPE